MSPKASWPLQTSPLAKSTINDQTIVPGLLKGLSDIILLNLLAHHACPLAYSPAELRVDGQHLRVADKGKSHNGHCVEHLREWPKYIRLEHTRFHPLLTMPLVPPLPSTSDTWKSPMSNTWLNSEKSTPCDRTRGPECGTNPIGLHTHL